MNTIQRSEAESLDEQVVVPDTDSLWRLRAAWQRRPWLAGIGVIGGAYFVGKGAWFLQEFIRSAG